MNNEVKKMAKELAKVKDAFIMEELKPYYTIENNNIIFHQKVRIRLAEILDYKKSLVNDLNKLLLKYYDLGEDDIIYVSTIIAELKSLIKKYGE